MARTDLVVASGSLLKVYQAMWAPTYAAVLHTLGSTGTLLPIGDPHYGQPNATTFTTKGEEQVTFTWSEAPSAFDTPLDLTNPDRWQGVIAVVELNGTDEEADSPDAAYWSRVGAAFSIGMWIRPDVVNAVQTLVSKWDATTGVEAREWEVLLQANGTVLLRKHDESVATAQESERPSSGTLTASQWVHVVVTDDGLDTATSINVYLDGSLSNGTASHGANYVAMEDLAQKVNLGFNTGTAGVDQFYNGRVAGGPCGPFFVQTELAADEVLRLYQLGRAALGV